jgi:hypothetical protein
VSDAAQKGQAALDKALTLEPHVARDSLYARALALLNLDWKHHDREMRAAATLVGAPHYRRLYALVLLTTGHFEDALDECGGHSSVDPLGIVTNTAYAHSLFWTRQYDEGHQAV